MNNASGGGIGFFGVLFIVLLVLKLTSVIAISWFWLFAVLWMPVVAALALWGIGLVIYLLVGYIRGK